MTNPLSKIRVLPLRYDRDQPRKSALCLAYAIRPDWQEYETEIDIHQFVGGLMNSLFKITRIVPGQSQDQNDSEAVLLRVYGLNTERLVDRELEAAVHAELAEAGLASQLLARFDDGLIYRFVPGRVCDSDDFADARTWKLVAATLGEWHARLQLPSPDGSSHVCDEGAECGHTELQERTQCDRPVPNIWTEMQSWISSLPEQSPQQQARKSQLQREFERSFSELEQNKRANACHYVIGHNDLLSANVIFPNPGTHPKSKIDTGSDRMIFIDYEFAKPAPAAFDLANHFSEWGGFECNYEMLPTRATRRAFVREYLESYARWRPMDETEKQDMLEQLLIDIDRYRGMPGFRWALHGLIEESITEIDFDWTGYAEKRLAEYWAWREEEDGHRVLKGGVVPARERRWAQEA